MDIHKWGSEILFPEGEPARVGKCFVALQVTTVGDLCQYTEEELVKVGRLKRAKATLNSIKEALACYDVGLKPKDMDEERQAIWEVEVGNADRERYPVDASFDFGANVVA